MLYLVVHSKVADLHRYGDEVDNTVELILFELLLQIYKLFLTEKRAVREDIVADESMTGLSRLCHALGLPNRAKNKALGLAGQAEILIGYLYNLIQSRSTFWVAIVENCTENGQWPAAILSSAECQIEDAPRRHLCLGQLHEVDHAGEVDQELQHDGQDGVEVEDVGKWALMREGSQRLGRER